MPNEVHFGSSFDFFVKAGEHVIELIAGFRSMTLKQCNKLDELEQLQSVWGAVILGERKTDLHPVKLHQIDEFFLEEYFDQSIDARVGFLALHNEELRDVYREQFRLSE